RREFWEEIHQLAADGLTVLITTHYMDEAERCHRLAYIAYGRLMAQGTVKEVVDGANLVTYQITGGNQPQLSRRLRESSAITQAVAFGTTLHVSGSDREAMESAFRDLLGPEHEWRPQPAGLEDVFISLMNRAEDNFG
ncbi:MAG: ABC transporter ATP-binding protein, partial [Planctomycetota bacterium]